MNSFYKNTLYTLSLVALITASSSCTNQPKLNPVTLHGDEPVASPKERYAMVEKYFAGRRAGKPIAVAQVDGLVCPSCAIGIRKNTEKLNFVDSDAPQKGVRLDVKNQLVVLSLKPGEKVNAEAFAGAVRLAGFKPVTFYELKNNGKGESVILSIKLIK